MRTVWVVAIALILAGCSALEPSDEATAVQDGGTHPVAEDSTWTIPEAEPPLVKSPIQIVVSMPDRWVKPRQNVVATVETDGPTNVSWFVRALVDEVRVAESSGFWYVGGKGVISSTPRHRALEPTTVAPGESTPSIAFPAPSRVVLAVVDQPTVSVNVTVDPGADPLVVGHATLIRDAHGLRFSPTEVTIHPDSVMRLWNGAPDAHTFIEQAYWVPVTPKEEKVTFLGVDTGAYDVMALARAAGAWGESVVRFVVDFESPPSRMTVGPFSGRVSAVSTLDAPSTRSHVFTVLHPMQSLTLTLRPSGLPEDASLTWTLEHEGTRVGGGAAAALEDIQWSSLPSGEYVLVLSTDGIRMSYEVTGSAHHALSPPDDG